MLLAVLDRALHGRVQQVVVDAGLLLVIKLPKHIDDTALAAQCQSNGLSVRPLSRYYIGDTDVRGLVVGFAYVDTNDLIECGKRLGEMISLTLG